MRFPNRSELEIGDLVEIEIYFHGKSNIEEGKITGFLTNADSHPRGIKVSVDSGSQGRVRKKIEQGVTVEGFYEEIDDDVESDDEKKIKELEHPFLQLRRESSLQRFAGIRKLLRRLPLIAGQWQRSV